MQSATKVQVRGMETYYRNYWYVRLYNHDTDESPLAHRGWIVYIWRSPKQGNNPSYQTELELASERENAIQKVLNNGDPDNGPEGEWAAYQGFDATLVEWCGDVAELY